jgi:two-component system, NtrC family, response regulator
MTQERTDPPYDVVGHDDLLVVDDEPAIGRLIALMLARSGILVQFAASGYEALTLIRTAPPALVLLDLNMPVMDGEAFLDEYEHLPAPRPPVVLFTAMREDAIQRVSSRVAAVLQKPVVKERLLQTIRQYWQPTQFHAADPEDKMAGSC